MSDLVSQPPNDIITLFDGEITIWIEPQTALFMKCRTKYDDPVELNKEQVEHLCEVLQKLVPQLD